MAPKKFILACKELNGSVYITRLPKVQGSGTDVDPYRPGVPSVWYSVGPGLRPSVQHYSGADNTFILTFEYLSHLVCRIIPDVNDPGDGGTWPPTTVDPTSITPGNVSITFAEAGIALKRLSSTSANNPTSYFYNPVLLKNNVLIFDSFTSTYTALIQPAVGWVPIVTPAITPFYRVYRRPLGSSGAWTMRMDWNTVLNFSDNEVAGIFQWEYTATWGTLFDPAFPNDNTRHNEGIKGDGTRLEFDSTIGPHTFQIPHTDSLLLPLQVMSASVGAGNNQLFHTQGPDDKIQLTKTRLEDSTSALCNAGVRSAFNVTAGDDSEQIPALLGKAQMNSAPAGMYT